jgi:hypothetical protein
MTTTNTKFVAKVAAVVAGLGLVLSSFALAIPAGAQTTTFTRDLTIGASGADVTALQNWLVSKGFSIPAGATGYFGTQTQAAVAAYQAANGITPAAGYFGPITRAKVNAGGPVTGGDDDDDDDNGSDGELSGGEADLSGFDINDEESSGAEGEEGVDIFSVEFDVEDGDVRVERFEIVASSTRTGTTASLRPWEYFDTIYLAGTDGEEIGEIDASDRDEWDEENTDDTYRLVFSGLDYIVDEDDNAEIVASVDISDGLDAVDVTNGSFDFFVPDDGIRARDSEGIDHYIPTTDSAKIDFDFEEEENGDLDINTSSDDPDNLTIISDEDDEGDETTVFVFELENNDDVDVLVTDLTVDVATSSLDSLDSLIESATLVVDGDEIDGDINDNGTISFEDADFMVGGDETVDVELVVTASEDADGTVDFSIDGDNIEAENDENGDESTVSGSASSETHTIALTGVSVAGVSDESDVNDAGTVGTFEIVFEVSAEGEDDVYVYKGASQTGSSAFQYSSGTASTTGVSYVIYQGGTASTTDFATDSALLTSGANSSGNYFRVESGETEEFTLTVTIDTASPTATALYYVELDAIRFDDENDTTVGSFNDTVYTVPDEAEFETSARSIAP